MTIAQTIAALNAAVLTAFLILLGANLFSMFNRFRLYRTAKLPVPVLLRRTLVLFGALAFIGGEAAVLRVLGITFAEDSVERLVFLIQSNVIFLGALAYYTKVELMDVDDPEAP